MHRARVCVGRDRLQGVSKAGSSLGWLSLPFAAVLACRPAPSAPPPAEGAATPPTSSVESEGEREVERGGFALVGGGSRIYLGPTLDADYVTLDPAWISRRLVAVGGGDGPLLSIEIAFRAQDADHCVKELDRSPLRLRAWTRPQDLTPVLTREVSVDFSDGTAARLRPGLAVELAEIEGEYQVSGRGVRITLPLPADAVGRRFTPGPAFSGAGATGTVPEGRRLMLDATREFDARGDWLYKVHAEGPAAEDRGDRKGGPLPIADFGGPEGLVRVRMRCAELTAQVLDESVPRRGRGPVPDETPPFMGLDELESRSVPGGLAVTWPDGTPAGTTLDDGMQTYGAMVGEAWCFQVLQSSRPRLGACVAASDLAP